MINELSRLQYGKSGRFSSWDTNGRNADAWRIEPGETKVLADIKGPGAITHIWMTQGRHYRECLLKVTWDNAKEPSILVPLGDFFCLGHNIVNSFESMLFTASTNRNNQFNHSTSTSTMRVLINPCQMPAISMPNSGEQIRSGDGDTRFASTRRKPILSIRANWPGTTTT